MTITKPPVDAAVVVATGTAVNKDADAHVATAPRPLTGEQLASLPRIHNPAVSPDGHWLIYSEHHYSLATNRHSSHLCLVDIHDAADDDDDDAVTSTTSKAIRLTESLFNTIDDNPFWIDSNTVGFLSSRSGYTQLWTATIAHGHTKQAEQGTLGRLKQLSHWYGHILTARYHQASRQLVFSAMVHQHGRALAGMAHTSRNGGSTGEKDSGIVYDQLYVRQWDRYTDGQRQQLFAVRIKQSLLYGYQIDDEPVNLMATHAALECPSYPFGSVHDYTLAPDARESCLSTGDDCSLPGVMRPARPNSTYCIFRAIAS
ncbi:hypothetical protein SYNPS1DRAFT_27281 [Syncephalis pseudoplumigaleata]|uniref:Uncharacterized protein n=1 Tax=Syncephalis pseudoplumigaleata TaxID=1712513 RepID=A0A4V1J222_9FUNG|nr:hypothetical protein SYNPS1DRAFT_27281 [Syncephalis pseudoplumigaleata]|eukprot:RKP27049.1 hypothetical protein SYNPS1DRAFT_27281 [Syncephalis pseudoplumigaleata]